MKKTNNTIYFVTTSQYKAKSYTKRFAATGRKLVWVNQELEESRDFSCHDVAVKKLKEASKNIQSRPLFVEDRGFEIDELNGFPGSQIKILTQTLGLEKLALLIGSKSKAKFTYAVSFIDKNEKIKHFKGEEKGLLTKPSKRAKSLKDVFCHHLFPNTPLSRLKGADQDKYEKAWTKEDALGGLLKYLEKKTKKL